MASAAERAGTPALPEDLVDVAKLVTAYYAEHPTNPGFADYGDAGGYEQEGHVAAALRRGMTSLVIDRSGRARIGIWGHGVPGGEAVHEGRHRHRGSDSGAPRLAPGRQPRHSKAGIMLSRVGI